MKAKVFNITLFDRSFLVMARTKAGALKALFDSLKEDVSTEQATGQEVYEAGRAGQYIIGHDDWADETDPRQQKLEPLDVDVPEHTPGVP